MTGSPPFLPRPRRMVATPAGPVECLVVRHPRARRLSLRVGGAGIRLTVPSGTSERAVARMLADNAGWIADRLDAAPPSPPVRDGALLALLDARPRLRLRDGAGRARLAGGALHLPVAAGDEPGAALERWYRREARRRLGAMARTRAARLGMPVAGVSVRDPRSRWGSCGAGGRLSFSWRLLLAPEFVAEHVVAHEACHLVHHDHSPAFWELLRAQDPRTDRARAWLDANAGLLRAGPTWPDGRTGAAAGP